MYIDVISSVNEAISDEMINKTVIVIDVLRATSTIVTALDNGCIGIIPVETVNQAKVMQQNDELLGGERFCKRIPGFHFGNSPLEYTREEVNKKKVILTTTNGTRAIQKAQRASRVFAGSLLNSAACVDAALYYGKDVIILCAGTHDKFSLEDGICAGLMVDQFKKKSKVGLSINDLGIALRSSYLQAESMISDMLLHGCNGIRLAKLGYKEDVHYCSQIDTSSIVPVLQHGVIVPL